MIKFIDSLIAWLTNPGAKAAELAAAIRSAGSLWSSTETQSKLDEKITNIQAGENVTINWLDPLNPTINAQGAGFGDMVGPASSVANNVPVFLDTSGKRLADSGIKLSDKADSSALAAKADLASPTFTGSPAAPTATPGTNTTQLATTAFVGAAVAAIPSGGDVSGPASSVADRIAVFNGTTGKLIKDGGVAIAGLATAAQGTKADSALQAADLAPTIHAATSKATPVDADELGLVDSAASNVLKRLTWANVKATLKTYFDTLYGAIATANQWTKPQRASITSITSATTMTIDLAANNDFECTSYAHNGTLANPTNQSGQINQKGTIIITQDGSGGHTLSFASNWKAIGSASAPSINTTAGVTTCIDYHVLSSTVIRYSLRAVGAA